MSAGAVPFSPGKDSHNQSRSPRGKKPQGLVSRNLNAAALPFSLSEMPKKKWSCWKQVLPGQSDAAAAVRTC
jgi:hypothetical protein